MRNDIVYSYYNFLNDDDKYVVRFLMFIIFISIVSVIVLSIKIPKLVKVQSTYKDNAYIFIIDKDNFYNIIGRKLYLDNIEVEYEIKKTEVFNKNNFIVTLTLFLSKKELNLYGDLSLNFNIGSTTVKDEVISKLKGWFN